MADVDTKSTGHLFGAATWAIILAELSELTMVIFNFLHKL